MSLIEQVRRNSAIWRQNGWNREADVMDTAGDRLEAMQAEIDRLRDLMRERDQVSNYHKPAQIMEFYARWDAALDRQGK